MPNSFLRYEAIIRITGYPSVSLTPGSRSRTFIS